MRVASLLASTQGKVGLSLFNVESLCTIVKSWS